MDPISDLDRLVIDGLVKGLPGGVPPFPLGEIAAQGWNVLREDLPLPLAVLKASALEHNLGWMATFLERADAAMAPHGKTTMSPQLFRRQRDAGAWAITVATAHQIRVCRHFGFERVVLANQLVGRQAIGYVLDELYRDPDFSFTCLVDSVDAVGLLDEAWRDHPLDRPLNLFLECGVPGGRTGCRDLATALQVAERIKQAEPGLALGGVEGFEGLIEAETPEAQEERVAAFLDFIVEIAAACDRRDLFTGDRVVLSAGGSAFYDMVVRRFSEAGLGRGVQVLTRSGCYLTHDSAVYRDFFARLRARSPGVDAQGEGLKPALELWTYVQSCPEPGRVILTMGKRDVSFDAGLPVPETWLRPGRRDRPDPVPEGCRLVALNDQHAYMDAPVDHPFRVGDMVSCGISHPCTTFDKWQVIPLVDDDYNVVSAITTFF